MAALNESLDSPGQPRAGCCFLLPVAVSLLKNQILCCDICFSSDACQKIKQQCAGGEQRCCRLWGERRESQAGGHPSCLSVFPVGLNIRISS